MAAKILPIETLQRLFRYDPESGNIYWIAEGKGKIKKKPAGTVVQAGYIGILIDGKRYYAHRIAWALHHGRHPELHLDHINGIKTDNRIANLREANHNQNARNNGLAKNNKTGFTGVSLHSSKRFYVASIKVDYIHINLGLFKTIDEAAAARKKAEKFYFQEWARQTT
jgi:hypothetical protein